MYKRQVRSLEITSLIPLVDPNGTPPYDVATGDYSNSDLYLDNFGLPVSQLANQERNHRFLLPHTISSGTSGLQMTPFRQETVFNWYLPDFAPSGPIADAGLVAPELQLANEPDLIRNINYQQSLIRGSNGISVDRLGGLNTTQRRAFGVTDNSDDSVDNHDNIILDRDKWAARLYPCLLYTSPSPRD